MIKNTRHRAEPEAPKQANPMEKDLASLKSIRESRLQKLESKYRSCVKSMNLAENKVKNQKLLIQKIKVKISNKKQTLSTHYLGQATNAQQISLWTSRERVIDEEIENENIKLIQYMSDFQQQQKLTHQAKIVVAEAQKKIEKLDILKSELDQLE